MGGNQSPAGAEALKNKMLPHGNEKLFSPLSPTRGADVWFERMFGLRPCVWWTHESAGPAEAVGSGSRYFQHVVASKYWSGDVETVARPRPLV